MLTPIMLFAAFQRPRHDPPNPPRNDIGRMYPNPRKEVDGLNHTASMA